jgi:hypothetical protein
MSGAPSRITVALLAIMTSNACAQQPQAPNAKSAAAPIGVAVYALSRGKGVPEPAAGAFSQAQALFRELQASKQIVRVHPIERLGIEGERRLCAEFANEEAARAAHARLLEVSKGIELFNVVIEPCVKS